MKKSGMKFLESGTLLFLLSLLLITHSMADEAKQAALEKNLAFSKLVSESVIARTAFRYAHGYRHGNTQDELDKLVATLRPWAYADGKLDQAIACLEKDQALELLIGLFTEAFRSRTGQPLVCHCPCRQPVIQPALEGYRSMLRAVAVRAAARLETPQGVEFATGAVSLYMAQGSRSSRERYPHDDLEYSWALKGIIDLAQDPAPELSPWLLAVARRYAAQAEDYRKAALAGYLRCEIQRLDLRDPSEIAAWLVGEIECPDDVESDFDTWYHATKSGERTGPKEFIIEGAARFTLLREMGEDALPVLLRKWEEMDILEKGKGLSAGQRYLKFRFGGVINTIREAAGISGFEPFPTGLENRQDEWLRKMKEHEEKRRRMNEQGEEAESMEELEERKILEDEANKLIEQTACRFVHHYLEDPERHREKAGIAALNELVGRMEEDEALDLLIWLFESIPRGTGETTSWTCPCGKESPGQADHLLRAEAVRAAARLGTPKSLVFSQVAVSIYLTQGSYSKSEQNPLADKEFEHALQAIIDLSEDPSPGRAQWLLEVARRPGYDHGELRQAAYAGYLRCEMERLNNDVAVAAPWILSGITIPDDVASDADLWHAYKKPGDLFGRKQFAVENAARFDLLREIGKETLPFLLEEWRNIDAEENNPARRYLKSILGKEYLLLKRLRR